MCSRSVYSSRLIQTCSGNQGCFSLNWDTKQLLMSSFFKVLSTQDWKTFCLNCGGSLKRKSLTRVLPSETPTNTIGFTPFPSRLDWDQVALLKSTTSTKVNSLFFFIPNPSSHVSGDFTKSCVNCFPGSLIPIDKHIFFIVFKHLWKDYFLKHFIRKTFKLSCNSNKKNCVTSKINFRHGVYNTPPIVDRLNGGFRFDWAFGILFVSRWRPHVFSIVITFPINVFGTKALFPYSFKIVATLFISQLRASRKVY